MALRAPKSESAQILSRADGVEAEILHEKAGNLSRLGTRLADALRELEAFDARLSRASAPSRADLDRREHLLGVAGEALWYYIVQREVCGLRDAALVMRELRVPRDVQLRMGLRATRPAG